MNKIYTFGDGFASGHIWPEWPQILQALLPDYKIVNTSAVGAGPEWLVHKFVGYLPEINNSTVIFQWPFANRFDKLIEDSLWKQIADSDPVYNFNQYTDNNETWWLSSMSTQPQVKEYHTAIQTKQHQARLNDYKILVKNTLENIGCSFIFTTTNEQYLFSNRPKYVAVRQKEIQPSPIVHFDWIISSILPQTTIKFSTDRANALKNLIIQQAWEPYHFDRDQIWLNLIDNLNKQTT
jgi:hypothetical protein